jgi:hypothetical protein
MLQHKNACLRYPDRIDNIATDTTMTENDIKRQLAKYDAEMKRATQPGECWAALQDLASTIVGFRLFTVMTVDMVKEEACRAYTSHPAQYPVSGTKPIHYDAWFDIVHRQQKLFIANTIADIAKVFPDHEKIWAMGCGSVVNLPVVIDATLAATINMLHEEQYYTDARVALIEKYLTDPAKRAYLAAAT